MDISKDFFEFLYEVLIPLDQTVLGGQVQGDTGIVLLVVLEETLLAIPAEARALTADYVLGEVVGWAWVDCHRLWTWNKIYEGRFKLYNVVDV